MRENRTNRSIASLLLAVVVGMLAPAVSWAAPRGAYILGVIDDCPTPITQIAWSCFGNGPSVACILGIIDESPDPITQTRIIEDGPGPITNRTYRLGVIDEGADPFDNITSRPVATRSR